MIDIAQPRRKAYLDADDVRIRYDIGINAAYEVIRKIQRVCGGGKLGPCKVLPSEVAFWESRCRREEEHDV